MPSISRTVFVILPIAVLAVLLGTPFTSQQALAKPMPVSRNIRSSGSGPITRNVRTLHYATALNGPPPAGQATTNPSNGPRPQSRSAKFHNPNRQASKGRSPKEKTTKGQPPNGQTLNPQPSNARRSQSSPRPGGQSQAAAPRPTTGTNPSGGTKRAPQSGSQSTKQRMAVLKQQQQGAAENAAQFHQLATQPNAQNDPEFQQGASNSLTEFHSHVLAAQGTLSELAAGKGLANFDAKAQLEVIIKEIANLIKEVLSDATALIGKLPIVGPLLEPLVFQIKCVVVDLIDASENFLDGVLNILAPISNPLLPGIV
ncbi:hypothetical protein PAXRUDRAFT_455876 [Paxillus rubicundulus Ve08.2h10]|uniref:Secreted protein n=1 Tax=Paxillus rubicundulus Ve08.2h10 TaxID=930991 RepID=A0A0D0E1T7_9AGAM|nr:hypothetical protein PAXRUDRAFT_455876 [Paxillus rubicundulus Ve08.2h10]